MADNTILNSGVGGDTIATDDIAGVKFQRVKLVLGADGSNDGDVASANPMPVQAVRPATGTVASVAASATNVTLLASNASRKGAMVYNDSAVALYLKLGATASSSSFTAKVFGNGYYELNDPAYTGIIDGLWDSASGNARVTELT